jgi:hypothetical protein
MIYVILQQAMQAFKTLRITAIPSYENNKDGKVSYQSRGTKASTLVTNKCIGTEH